MEDKIKVGLIGFGTVGTGVAKLLFEENKPLLKDREIDIDLIKIADLDITTDRGISIPEGILTTNVDEILDNPVMYDDHITGHTEMRVRVSRAGRAMGRPSSVSDAYLAVYWMLVDQSL